MKIALFTETYIPNVNGVVAHVQTLKNGLEQLGHEVLVVTADKHARHHYVEDGILHCPAAEIKKFYGFGAATPISRKRQRLISEFEPDVIHIHHEFGIGLSGIWAARALKKPLVYTLHTMYDQYIYYVAPRPLLRAATKMSHKYNRFIARRATAITGPSQKCGEYFKRIGVDKELNLIPNSADLEAFDPQKIPQDSRRGLRAQYEIPEDRLIACFCGRLGKEKSVDVLLEYFSNTITPEDNIHLLIIGDGPDMGILKALVERLDISDRVTFAGMVKHKDMPLYFATADVYITASLSEMNSISMLEGMASGMPVLQRYDELNADQIASGKNGYLFNSQEEMAQKLREIKALSAGELQELKNRVSESVKSRGSTDLASYMLSVYNKAIQEKQRAITTKESL